MFRKKIKCDVYFCRRKGHRAAYFSGDADDFIENHLCKKHRKAGKKWLIKKKLN